LVLGGNEKGQNKSGRTRVGVFVDMLNVSIHLRCQSPLFH